MKMILIALGAAVSLSALAQTEGLEKLPSFK